ncbi:hypothetical protein ACQP1W_31405 [Spirillospora sp. CA-255316]
MLDTLVWVNERKIWPGTTVKYHGSLTEAHGVLRGRGRVRLRPLWPPAATARH